MLNRRASMLAVCAIVLAVAIAHADTASLTVDVGRPGAKISPDLYGIFFEEINHAGDGGIYAELVRNRSFEDAQSPAGWEEVKRGSAEGKIALDTDRPLNPENPHSLRVEITKAEQGIFGIANGGYWGIAVAEGARYQLSFYARADNAFRAKLNVRLEDASNKTLAETTVGPPTSEWKRYECALTARGTDPSARLVLSASAPGTI